MKHIKLFESFIGFPNTEEDINRICEKYDIKNYTINDDMSIDVDGDVNLANRGLGKLPLKFNRVRTNFNCNFNKLNTLEGAPKEVGGDFNCNINQLTTLEGSPFRVGGGFYCGDNQLTDLKFAPETVGDFYCDENQLVTLLGSPWKVSGDFRCNHNKLTTLEGSPLIVDGDFYCGWNWSLITLVGGPNTVGGSFYCDPSPIHSLYRIFDENYKWFKESIKEYSWLYGTEISKMRLCDVFLDLDLPEPDLSKIDKVYTVI